MSNYYRVIPRDLFNEAKLLKCMGKLVLCIEDRMIEGLVVAHCGDAFEVVQNQADGSISLENIQVYIKGKNGHSLELSTPLNSKEAWPMQATIGDNCIDVFTEQGELTQEFKDIIKGKAA